MLYTLPICGNNVHKNYDGCLLPFSTQPIHVASFDQLSIIFKNFDPKILI